MSNVSAQLYQPSHQLIADTFVELLPAVEGVVLKIAQLLRRGR